MPPSPPPTPPRRTILYQTPPSFYSQIARLVLCEKGVPFERYLAAAGPPTFETYEPWYMRLNPAGTVPTLVVGDEAIPDSRRILRAVDERFEGPSLTPRADDQRALMATWIERAYASEDRALEYGSGLLRRIGPRVNAARLRALAGHRARNPDLRDVYDAKIADIQAFMASAGSAERVGVVRARKDALLDELDRHLRGRTFICDEGYSLADVVWTVSVARVVMHDELRWEARPDLRAWYERMRARPSFVAANVWERFHPEILLPQVMWKLRYRLLGVVAAAAVVTALVLRAL